MFEKSCLNLCLFFSLSAANVKEQEASLVKTEEAAKQEILKYVIMYPYSTRKYVRIYYCSLAGLLAGTR